MTTPYTFSIFLVDDDIWYSELLEHHLSLNPENLVTRFETGKQLLKNLFKSPSVIVLDYSLADYKGDELLKKIKNSNADIPVIIVSGQEDVSTAINLLNQGAYDYIVKNDETKDRLWATINNIREKIELKNEITSLRKEVVRSYLSAGKLIGESKAIKNILPLIEKAYKSSITVSITGETGTGKEVVAKSIHYSSDRKEKKFVAVNVTAIPSELIESELFGHEKGAFTGAVSRRIGKFEEANKGTLFLDEIGEMDLNMQAKLLRVLQEKEFTRVGGNEIVKVDVRVIVATHKDLTDEVKKGKFREDLFYRILGLPIELPPLRDRNNDIILIAEHFIENYCKENKLKKFVLSLDAQKKLLNYDFPGNVRELKSIIDLACIMTESTKIEAEHIRFHSTGKRQDTFNKKRTLNEYIKEIIFSYLEKYDNNVLLVAEKLNVGKSTIYRMLQEKKDGTEKIK